MVAGGRPLLAVGSEQALARTALTETLRGRSRASGEGSATRAWPGSEEELEAVQRELAAQAAAILGSSPWEAPSTCHVAACFVAGPRDLRGRGSAGDRAWAAAVVWRVAATATASRGEASRRCDLALRGSSRMPRRARDIEDQVVVEGTLPWPYVPGLLALRHGAILAEAVTRLGVVPDVLLVDGTGLDHPRRCGLAVHLGALTAVPTVGVTHRPLLATGEMPSGERGGTAPVELGGEVVGYWVRTRRGARPVLAHAGWRTSPETAAAVVLMGSTNSARTPVPLQEARRVAREARAASTPRST